MPQPHLDIPNVALPTGEKVSILSPDLTQLVPKLPQPLQRKIVRLLDSYLQEAHSLPQGTVLRGKVKGLLADEASWQLAQSLRYSTPTRIGEAVSPLTFLVESHRRIHRGTRVDVIPALYLAVALSRNEGEEQRAIRTFNEAIEHINDIPQQPVKNLLWARANMARMYRHMGKIAEAENQERLTREWLVTHPYAYPPSEINGIFADDVGTGSYIIDHADVVRIFGNIQEIGPNVAIANGMGVFYNLPGPQPASFGGYTFPSTA